MKGKNIGLLAILIIFSLVIVGIGNAVETWVAPTAGATISAGTNLNVTIAAGDADTANRTTFRYAVITAPATWVDIANATNVTSGALWAFNITWDTTARADGNYTINATVYDASNLVLASKTRNVFIDNTAISFSAPQPSQNAEQRDNTTITGFSITTSEYYGPTQPILYFDNTPYTMTNTSDARTAFTYTTPITGLGSGQHQWYVTASGYSDTGISNLYSVLISSSGKMITCDDGNLANIIDECGKVTSTGTAKKSWIEENYIIFVGALLLIGLYYYSKNK